MMLPLPWASIMPPKAWQQKYVPLRLRSRMKLNLSSGNSSAGLRKAEPALLTRMSTRPCVALDACRPARNMRALGDVEIGDLRLAALLGDRGAGLLGARHVHVGQHHVTPTCA